MASELERARRLWCADQHNKERMTRKELRMYQNGDKIDGKALIAAVRVIAAEKPDFVYPANPFTSPSCLYTTETGAPDCIIGHAMAYIGQPLPPQVREHECWLLNEPVGGEGWYAVLDGISPSEFEWLNRVQREQDTGTPWGDAALIADRMVAEDLPDN